MNTQNIPLQFNITEYMRIFSKNKRRNKTIRNVSAEDGIQFPQSYRSIIMWLIHSSITWLVDNVYISDPHFLSRIHSDVIFRFSQTLQGILPMKYAGIFQGILKLLSSMSGLGFIKCDFLRKNEILYFATHSIISIKPLFEYTKYPKIFCQYYSRMVERGFYITI